MQRSWTDKIGLNELGSKLGTGGVAGFISGGVLSLLAINSGFLNIGGWLSLLVVPATALIGSALGDYITKNGSIFGKNGLKDALTRKFEPKKIPEGYLAVAPDAKTFAVSSETIIKTGHVHANGVKTMHSDELLLGYQERRALDSFVEFDLNNDPRLAELRKKAQKYGERFAVKDSPEYIDDVHQREERLTKVILADVFEKYGAYSVSTLSGGEHNDAEYDAIHHPKRYILGGKSVDFALMAKGQLVCRHYAPIMSALLHEARVPNHMIASTVGMVRNHGGHFELDKTYIGRELTESGWDSKWQHHISPHVYVITDEGNAIVEGTVAGRPDDDVDEHDRVRKAYAPIVNGITVHDIIFNEKTAIPEIANGTMQLIYGGDKGAGKDYYKNAETIIEDNVEKYDAQQQSEVKGESVDKARQQANELSILNKRKDSVALALIDGALVSPLFTGTKASQNQQLI